MAQLMPLPVTVSCFSKTQVGLLFWFWLTRVVAERGRYTGVFVCALHKVSCPIQLQQLL